jgi:hypothetical protein
MIVKAITILQPFASLIAVGAKMYETRSWATKYQGPIAIHAGKCDMIYGLSSETVDAVIKAFAGTRHDAKRAGMNCDCVYPFGAVVAVAELKGCHRIIRTHTCDPDTGKPSAIIDIGEYGGWRIDGDDLLFGDFTPGRFAWELADVKPLKEPVPARGRQGLWTLPPEALARACDGHNLEVAKQIRSGDPLVVEQKNRELSQMKRERDGYRRKYWDLLRDAHEGAGKESEIRF